MLHPNSSISVERAVMLQALNILKNAGETRVGEEAVLTFTGAELRIESGGGGVAVRTSGGWDLQIRVPSQMLLSLAEVLPDEDPLSMRVEGGTSFRIGPVGIPCYLQPVGSKVIDLPVNADHAEILEALTPHTSQEIEMSGLAEVHRLAMERRQISIAAELLLPFGVSEQDLLKLVESRNARYSGRKATHSGYALKKEYFLLCATSDHSGMSGLARLNRKLAISSGESFTINFAEEVRSDSTYRCDSNFAAALAVVLARVQDRGKEFTFGVVPRIVEDLFVKNWFFHGIGLAAKPEESHTTRIPFRSFKTSEINEFLDYMEQTLEGKGLPPLDSTFCLQLLQCLGEIFVNTETHSDSALGVFVCGQHYPAQQRLVLTVADAGVTIPERIASRKGKHFSPVDALEWAMKKGNTTKIDTPGGIGLKLVRDFAREQHGEVWIASGGAFWEMQSGEEAISELDDPFPGTVVTLKIPTEPTPGAVPPELSNLSTPPTSSHE
jgi:hypothetical protein